MRHHAGRGSPIAVIPVGLTQWGDELLVFYDHDPVTGRALRRPLGGGTEFGARRFQALRREFRQQIGANPVNAPCVDTPGKPCTWRDEPGHEIVWPCGAGFRSEDLPEMGSFMVRDDQDQLGAYWISYDRLERGRMPLYPSGPLPALREERGI
jgi:hypothetical protein